MLERKEHKFLHSFFCKEAEETVSPLQSVFFIPVSKIYYQEKKNQSSINCLVLKKESHTGSQGWGSKRPNSKTVQYQNGTVPKRPQS